MYPDWFKNENSEKKNKWHPYFFNNEQHRLRSLNLCKMSYKSTLARVTFWYFPNLHTNTLLKLHCYRSTVIAMYLKTDSKVQKEQTKQRNTTIRQTTVNKIRLKTPRQSNSLKYIKKILIHMWHPSLFLMASTNAMSCSKSHSMMS